MNAASGRTMQIFFNALAGTLLALGLASGAAKAEELAGKWVEGFDNKARLIAGKASGGAVGQEPVVLAGIDIAMSPGFKTYWRNPGEAGGVPPEFDFSGSENLAGALVLYPAPHRTKDKAGENIAYKDRVLFPVVVAPKDGAKPIHLKLKAAYGVCKDICIPAEAELEISIPQNVASSDLLTAAVAMVPAEASDPSLPVRPDFGLHGGVADLGKDPVLSAWRIDRAGGKAKLILDVKDPGAAEGDAFLYSADGLYMPMTSKVPGKAQYEAELTEGASLKELAGKRISVTLSGAKGQSETFIQLPKDLAAP